MRPKLANGDNGLRRLRRRPHDDYSRRHQPETGKTLGARWRAEADEDSETCAFGVRTAASQNVDAGNPQTARARLDSFRGYRVEHRCTGVPSIALAAEGI